KGKGGADLRLTSTLIEKAPRQTEVTTVSRVNITGILAQMGRGMIEDVSDQMFKVFSERMKTELESAEPPAQPQAVAVPAVIAPAEALDLGSVGARAMLRRPGFWIALAVVAIGAWLFFR